MKPKPLFMILVSFVPALLVGCGQAQTFISPISTFLPTSTSTPTATDTPTPTSTITPSPTPTPQTLGRIFPDDFHGQAVWSNAGGNAFRDYVDTGWCCPPPDYGSTNCRHHLIHFDVSLPTNFGPSDYILSPVEGTIENIYSVGEGQFSIVIKPNPPFAGVEALLLNRERIDTLAKGIFEFNYEIKDVSSVSLHIAHVVPLVEIGQPVHRGQQIATVYFPPHDRAGIAYVIYIHMKDGTYWQFSPCDVLNDDEFCGKCTPGTIYPCP